MPYNNMIDRDDAGALIPEDVSREMIKRATEKSAALSLFRPIPVSRKQLRVPVLSSLPMAYWVDGDNGLKQTSKVAWKNKFLNVEELAVIIPVPDSVVADAEIDIWDEMTPYAVEAIGVAFDEAIFFGYNAPASFPTNISAAAAAAGNSVTEGDTAAQGAFFGDIDETIALVEEDGFDVNGFVAARSARGKLRASRATDGQRLDQSRVSPKLDELDGSPIIYPMTGSWPVDGGGDDVRLFAGDWSEFVVGVRQDIQMKILTEAVIQDNTGEIIYNLAQQDMTAIRLTFRGGWQVSNRINRTQPDEDDRYPVARLVH